LLLLLLVVILVRTVVAAPTRGALRWVLGHSFDVLISMFRCLTDWECKRVEDGVRRRRYTNVERQYGLLLQLTWS
jgi:hypothetical protein